VARATAIEHRKNIVSAAIRVMAKEGIPAATTRRIATEAGVAQTTIHYVFGSKTELYRAVIGAVSDNLTRTVERSLGAEEAEWADGFDSTVSAVWSMISADPMNALLVIELTIYALRDPELRDLAVGLHDSYQRAGEVAAAALRKRADREFAVTAQETTAVTVAGVNGLVLSFLTHGDDQRAQRDVKNLIAAVAALADTR
jgi:AcrR family transcriptional regulator